MARVSVNVTAAQAAHLAGLIERARTAKAEADAVCTLLALGHVASDASLVDVDVEGALVFEVADGGDGAG